MESSVSAFVFCEYYRIVLFQMTKFYYHSFFCREYFYESIFVKFVCNLYPSALSRPYAKNLNIFRF